jgi:hypothetical protein
MMRGWNCHTQRAKGNVMNVNDAHGTGSGNAPEEGTADQETVTPVDAPVSDGNGSQDAKELQDAELRDQITSIRAIGEDS